MNGREPRRSTTGRALARFAGLVLIVTGAVPSTAQRGEAELNTFHCLHGCPIGAPAKNDVVVREIYTLSSNDLTKLAD